MNWFLTPQEIIQGNNIIYYGPRFFRWRWNESGLQNIGFWYYGFFGSCLVLADLTAQQKADLLTNPGTYALVDMTPPDFIELDSSIPAGERSTITTAFEGAMIPADWLTPASTQRELIRRSGGIFQIMNRFAAVSTETTVAAGNGAPTITETQIVAPSFDFTPFQSLGASLYTCRVTGIRDGRPIVFFGYIGEAESGAANIYRDKLDQLRPGWNSEIGQFDSFSEFNIYLAAPNNIYNDITLTTQFKNWPPHTQDVFKAVVQYFGYDPWSISQNATIRSILKIASDDLINRPWSVGHSGYIF